MSWTLLRDLPEPDRRRIMRAATRRTYARGEAVFHEGDAGDALHLISRGRVVVRASTPTGEIATFAVLGPGSFFGEQVLVSGRHARTPTVAALEPLDTLAVGHATFEDLRRAHPSVERFLVEVLAAQVRRLSAHLLEALYLPAEKRVARRLVVLAGTTRPTVDRVLREMQDAGAVRLARGRVEIVDLPELRRRAA